MSQIALVSQVSAVERAAFYKQTYMHLVFGLGIFILLEAVLLNTPWVVDFMLQFVNGKLNWLFLLGGFMAATWVAQSIAYQSLNPMIQYAGYLIYILAQALIFVPMLYIAMNMEGGNDIILQAVIVTGGLFLGLTAVVFLTSVNFSFLKIGLTVGFFIALGLIIAGSIFGFNLGLWFSAAMVLLAMGSILYSTYNIKNEFNTAQAIPAALSLFASVMLLFWYILQIFMRR